MEVARVQSLDAGVLLVNNNMLLVFVLCSFFAFSPLVHDLVKNYSGEDED
jgi:hypothetical protein